MIKYFEVKVDGQIRETVFSRSDADYVAGHIAEDELVDVEVHPVLLNKVKDEGNQAIEVKVNARSNSQHSPAQAELFRQRDEVMAVLLELDLAPDVARERANNMMQALAYGEPVRQVVMDMISGYINESDITPTIYTIKKITCAPVFLTP